MRSDRGLSELTASVVLGIVITSVMFEAGAEGAISIAGRAPPPCGAAAFALCCITARESAITETTGKNKISHRIFMDTNLYSLWDEPIHAEGNGRHPGGWRYANRPLIVPIVTARTKK